MSNSDPIRKLKVAVLGLEKLGVYSIPEIKNLRYEVSFVRIDAKSASLDSFDFVIVPSGVFEKITTHLNPYSGEFGELEYDRDLLLSRERQLRNHLLEKGTVCLLIRDVRDRLPNGYHSDKHANDTDLVKRILNAYGVRRELIDPSANIVSEKNEFIGYLKEFGVAETQLKLWDRPYTVLARRGSAEVGMEIGNRLFALPFHADHLDDAKVVRLVTSVVDSVMEYQQKNELLLPSWLDSIEFQAEVEIRDKLQRLNKEVADLEGRQEVLRRYKGILTASGPQLVSVVAEVLRDYFGLKIDARDERKEDLKILRDDGSVLALVEVKGVKGGIKLENINQVDSHRERSGFSVNTQGVLIANTSMDVPSLEKRLAHKVEPDQIRRALNMNVLILRTVELLDYMKQVEGLDKVARKAHLETRVAQGGGWFSMSKNGPELVKVGTSS